MGQNSLRKAFEYRYSGLDLSKGIRHQNNFYHGANCKYFPYKSLRTLIQSLEWPGAWAPLPFGLDFPKDSEPGWSDELNGVTHDDKNWYFSQNPDGGPCLWKFPVGHNLNEHDISHAKPDRGILKAGNSPELYDQGYNHFGDIDYYEGLLYVALEWDPDLPYETVSDFVRTHRAAVAIFRAHDLSYLSYAQLPEQADAPWCAINPLNGLLYSSNFNADSLFVYRRLMIANNVKGLVGVELELLPERFELHNFDIRQQMRVSRVQGGAFSPRGHLYLVSDSQDDGVIRGFDMTTGCLSLRFQIGYEGSEELEGITIWDLPGNGPAPNLSGQIHVIMIDNWGSGDDDLYFKHFWVVEPEDIDRI